MPRYKVKCQNFFLTERLSLVCVLFTFDLFPLFLFRPSFFPDCLSSNNLPVTTLSYLKQKRGRKTQKETPFLVSSCAKCNEWPFRNYFWGKPATI